MVAVAPYGVVANPCSFLANLPVGVAVNHPPKHAASVRFGPGKSGGNGPSFHRLRDKQMSLCYQ